MITTLEHLLLGYLPFWSLLRPALCTAGDPSSEQGWDHLMTIGYGETTTYSAIARARQPEHGAGGRPQCGAQPDQPRRAVPPGRRLGDSLTGFAGGLDRKRFLLDLEQSAETKAERLFRAASSDCRATCTHNFSVGWECALSNYSILALTSRSGESDKSSL